MNEWHVNCMQSIKDAIALNYAGSNNINTPYWKFANSTAKKSLSQSLKFDNWCKNITQKESSINKNADTKFWPFDEVMMKQYIDGYNINLNEMFLNN